MWTIKNQFYVMVMKRFQIFTVANLAKPKGKFFTYFHKGKEAIQTQYFEKTLITTGLLGARPTVGEVGSNLGDILAKLGGQLPPLPTQFQQPCTIIYFL